MKRILLSFFALFFVFSAGAHAGTYSDIKHVSIDLVADKQTPGPGDTVRIGIVHHIEPGWHIYWKNPGDSGIPPAITWTAPEGVTASEIKWPAPKKLPMGPLTNYGYEGDVTLLQDLTLPNPLPQEPVTLTAQIDLLVCHEICIPETHTVSLTFGEDMGAAYDPLQTTDASLPYEAGWDSVYREDNGDLIFEARFDDGTSQRGDCKQTMLFPEEWGLVDNTAEASCEITPDGFILRQKRGERDLSEVPVSHAVLTFVEQSGFHKHIRVSVRVENAAAGATTGAKTPDIKISHITVWQAAMLALLGGFILNLMPCVFPVLSIKALSLVSLKGKEEYKARLYGFAYAAGILVSFGLIAGVLISLKSAGAQIGWGFQLQNPVMILILSYLLFLIGLNLSGFFEFSGRLAGVGSWLTQKHGYTGSFFTGVLATLVATPCTAPFMGVAMGFALTQPAFVSLTIFLTMGLGLALPYLALCFIPALRHRLPKPGAWMETFRQFLAFPMFASAAWLVWVLAQQTEAMGVFSALLGMTALAFAIWLFKVMPAKGAGRFISFILMIAALVFTGSTLTIKHPMTSDQPMLSAQNEGDNWEPYSEARLNELLDTGYPVFVNMTAAWCITCKVNDKVALDIDATRQLFSDSGIQYLKGDWTNQNPEITQYLARYGRSGVPIYVYYGPRDETSGERPEPVVLPQILTPGIVKDAVSNTHQP